MRSCVGNEKGRISMTCDSVSFVITIFSTLITLIALIFAIRTIRTNTNAMNKSNALKEQENSLKYIYDRRTLLRNKLVWLSRIVHQNPDWCMLQIDDNNHPYTLSDSQWENAPKCSEDKFCNTILNELNWLRGEMKILFPTILEKYLQYCNLLETAYTTWMKQKDHTESNPDKYMKQMTEAYYLWIKIVSEDMPNVMGKDFIRTMR